MAPVQVLTITPGLRAVAPTVVVWVSPRFEQHGGPTTRRCDAPSNASRPADRGHVDRDRFRRTPTRPSRSSATVCEPPTVESRPSGCCSSTGGRLSRVGGQFDHRWPAGGQHLVIDYTTIGLGLPMFCAAWSRYPFVRFASNETGETTLGPPAECFEEVGGAHPLHRSNG